MNASYKMPLQEQHPKANAQTIIHLGWTSLTPLLSGTMGVAIGLLLGNSLGWL